MKKFLTKAVALLAVLTVLMSMMAIPAVAETPTATAWLLYFASPSWWPQYKEMNQAVADNGGITADKAIITGPGKYTTALRFSDLAGEGALQFNLVLDNAQVAFPGYYLKVTDIRINGESVAIKDNLYGEFHDNKKAGFAPLYNNYWTATEGPDLSTMSAFDGTIDTETHQVIDPALIKAAKSIEVDFIFAKNPGEEPAAAPAATQDAAAGEEAAPVVTTTGTLGQKPDTSLNLLPHELVSTTITVPVEPEAPETPETPDYSNAATAQIKYLDNNNWLLVDGNENSNISAETIMLNGEGHYTATMSFLDKGGWNHGKDTTGANRLYLHVTDPAGTDIDGMYIGISEVRVDGKAIDVGNVGYGKTYYNDSYWKFFTENDYYAVLFDKYQVDAGKTAADMGLTTWDQSTGDVAAIDPSVLTNFVTLEIDFFVTAQQGVKPPVAEAGDNGAGSDEEEKTEEVEILVPKKATWYNNCTIGVAGLSLSDLGIENDWHNIVPVDLTKNAYYVFPLVGADAYVVGNAMVTVNNGFVYVTCDYAEGNFREHRQCIKWFTSLDQVSKKVLADNKGGYECEDVLSIAEDLGGATMAYLSINNKASFRNPFNQYGQELPRYWRNAPEWRTYRNALLESMD